MGGMLSKFHQRRDRLCLLLHVVYAVVTPYIYVTPRRMIARRLDWVISPAEFGWSEFGWSQADMPFVPQHPLPTRFLVKLPHVSWVRVLLLWVVLQLGDVNWNPAYWAYESHVNLHAPSCIPMQWLGRSEERQKERETETESETGHENIVM